MTTNDTPADARALDALTLETTLADLPVGCTLLICRVEYPPGFRVVLRDDMPLQSWESAYIRDIEQLGEIVGYAIELLAAPPPAPVAGREEATDNE